MIFVWGNTDDSIYFAPSALETHCCAEGKYKSPTDEGQHFMALNVQFFKLHNHLTNEDIIVPRLVNQQTLDFNAVCEYLADGSTVTAADVAAVMKQIENRLPLILGLNAKVVCSPEGLTFRPKVSGSVTQSQLKKKLQAKLEADPTAIIDVNRVLSTSDLSTSDLTAEISIELPKVWNERFRTKATFKRVSKANLEDADISDESSGAPTGGGSSTSGNSGSQNNNESNTGGGNENSEDPEN